MPGPKSIITFFSVMTSISLTSIFPNQVDFIPFLYCLNFFFALVIITLAWEETAKSFSQLYHKEQKINEFLPKDLFAGFKINSSFLQEEQLATFVENVTKKNSLLRKWLKKVLIAGCYLAILNLISGDPLFVLSYGMLPVTAFVLLNSIYYWGQFVIGNIFFLIIFCVFSKLNSPLDYALQLFMFFIFFINLSWLNSYYWYRLANSATFSFTFLPVLKPALLFTLVFTSTDYLVKDQKSIWSQFMTTRTPRKLMPKSDIQKVKALAENLPSLSAKDLQGLSKQDFTSSIKSLQNTDTKLESFLQQETFTPSELKDYTETIGKKLKTQKEILPKILSEFEKQKDLSLDKIRLRNALQKMNIDFKKIGKKASSQIEEAKNTRTNTRGKAIAHHKLGKDVINKLEASKRQTSKIVKNLEQKIKEEDIKRELIFKKEKRKKRLGEFALAATGLIILIWVFSFIFKKNKINHMRKRISKEDKLYLKKLLDSKRAFKSFNEEVDHNYKVFHQAINKLFFKESEAPPALIIPDKKEDVPIEHLRKIASNLGQFFNAIHFAKHSEISKKQQRFFRKNFSYFRKFLAKQIK